MCDLRFYLRFAPIYYDKFVFFLLSHLMLLLLLLSRLPFISSSIFFSYFSVHILTEQFSGKLTIVESSKQVVYKKWKKKNKKQNLEKPQKKK